MRRTLLLSATAAVIGPLVIAVAISTAIMLPLVLLVVLLVGLLLLPPASSLTVPEHAPAAAVDSPVTPARPRGPPNL